MCFIEHNKSYISVLWSLIILTHILVEGELLKRHISVKYYHGQSGTTFTLNCQPTLLLFYVLCQFVFSETAPSHQQSLTELRGSTDLVKFALNTALQKLKEVERHCFFILFSLFVILECVLHLT